jgi:hypothetical protein
LNGEANRARQRQKRAIIAAEVKRFAHVINTNGVLGTHNGVLRPSMDFPQVEIRNMQPRKRPHHEPAF